MIPRIRAEVRDEIVRLRGERLTLAEIARIVGVTPSTCQRVCAEHFSDRLKRAKEALRREVNLARAEAHTAPLFHPEAWG
jgi:AraC-like DNA-binding protein